MAEAGLENGAVKWASGAAILESGAGGVWESEAELRKQKGKKPNQDLHAS